MVEVWVVINRDCKASIHGVFATEELAEKSVAKLDSDQQQYCEILGYPIETIVDYQMKYSFSITEANWDFYTDRKGYIIIEDEGADENLKLWEHRPCYTVYGEHDIIKRFYKPKGHDFKFYFEIIADDHETAYGIAKEYAKQVLTEFDWPYLSNYYPDGDYHQTIKLTEWAELLGKPLDLDEILEKVMEEL